MRRTVIYIFDNPMQHSKIARYVVLFNSFKQFVYWRHSVCTNVHLNLNNILVTHLSNKNNFGN